MRKNALIICCFVCALGAFGAFSRWLQTQLAFDKETGMMNASLWNVLVPLVLIASAAGLYFLIKKVLAGLNAPTKMHEVFRGTSIVLPVTAWAAGGMLAIGGITMLFTANSTEQRGAMAIIGLLLILSGLAFPAICTSAKRHLSPNLVSVFSSLPIAAFTVWLLACYIRNANVPNVWLYGLEIITVCIVIGALYYNAGFAYGKPRPYHALYTSMLGAFACLVSLADSRTFGQQLVFCATAAMLLVYCWMIVSNMRETDDTPEEEEKEETPAEESTEPVLEEIPVIPAGEKIATAEPTIQAPEKSRDDEIDSIIDEFKNKIE